MSGLETLLYISAHVWISHCDECRQSLSRRRLVLFDSCPCLPYYKTRVETFLLVVTQRTRDYIDIGAPVKDLNIEMFPHGSLFEVER